MPGFRKLFLPLGLALALCLSMLSFPAQPAAAQNADGPHLCSGGESSRFVSRYDQNTIINPVHAQTTLAIGSDQVCVPNLEFCASHISTRGPRLAPPQADPVSEIICRSSAQGVVPFGDSYVRYITERRYSPDGAFLYGTERIAEVIQYPTPDGFLNGQPVYLDVNVGLKSQATSVAELAYALDFSQDDANVLRLYWAFFNRMPDLGGAQYWLELSRNELTLDEIAEYFSRSEEFGLRYGEVNSEEFLAIVYQNVLGRTYDQGGFDYWLGLLDSGDLTRGGTVRWVAASAEFIGEHPYPYPVLPSQLDRWPDAGQHILEQCGFSLRGRVTQTAQGTVLLSIDLRTDAPTELDYPEHVRFACARALYRSNTVAFDGLTLNGLQVLDTSSSAQYFPGRSQNAMTFRATFPDQAWSPSGDNQLLGAVVIMHEVNGAFAVDLSSVSYTDFLCPTWCV